MLNSDSHEPGVCITAIRYSVEVVAKVVAING